MNLTMARKIIRMRISTTMEINSMKILLIKMERLLTIRLKMVLKIQKSIQRLRTLPRLETVKLVDLIHRNINQVMKEKPILE
jgi:hypothetical protein